MKNSKAFYAIVIAAVASILAAIYLVFIYAPVEATLGFSQKIFYFHVPLAWVGLLAFLGVFIASVAYLKNRNKSYHIAAKASAEIGLLFTTLVLITGPIWAKPAWGTWWMWDVRLTTTLILWLLYVGYLMLGSSVEEEDKVERFSAVYGIVAFVDVPLVFFSIRWWRSIHPVVFEFKAGGMNLDPQMQVAFFTSLFAFTILFAAILFFRIKLGLAEEEVNCLKESENA
jgi:heme exporter protein C